MTDRLRNVLPALRRHHWALLILAVVVVVLVMLDTLVDEPVRRLAERRLNAGIKGYSVRLPDADLKPWNLTWILRDLEIRQERHPEPPVASFGSMRFSVQWRALLKGRLVANCVIDRPSLHIDTRQLREEWDDRVSFEKRGWQALWEIYPVEVNQATVRNGAISYIDTPSSRRFQLSGLNAVATNIRHVNAGPRFYPSPVQLEATVFERGRLVVKGHANFLLEPHVGANLVLDVTDVPLASLGTVIDDYRVKLQGGVFSARGQVEVAPETYIANLQRVAVRGLRMNYQAGEETARIAKAKKQAVQAARFAQKSPTLRMRVQRLDVQGNFAYLSDTEPRYRVFMDNADITVRNLSNRAAQGQMRLTGTGRFMGSGNTRVRAAFRPGKQATDAAVDVRVGKTEITTLNDLLRAHGKLDASSGEFSLFSQLRITDGEIRGYVKPLFKDLDVYDPADDADDSFFRKIYERLAETIAEVLENQPRDEVVTIARLSGTVKDPDVSTWQVVAKLLRNAFIEAILPGFEAEAARQRELRQTEKKESPPTR